MHGQLKTPARFVSLFGKTATLSVARCGTVGWVGTGMGGGVRVVVGGVLVYRVLGAGVPGAGVPGTGYWVLGLSLAGYWDCP